MKKHSLYSCLCLATVLVTMVACDPWKDDTQLKDARYGQTLYEMLSAQSQLSDFMKVVDATSYADMLKNGALMTVFAPVNGTLPSLEGCGQDELGAWVATHIVGLQVVVDADGDLTVEGEKTDRLKMLSGKCATITGQIIKESNLPAGNGILHILTEPLPYYLNVSQMLATLGDGYEQIACIGSYQARVMDMDRSVQTGLDPNTGQPVYDTVWAEQNSFLDLYPLDDEEGDYSVVLLAQSALDSLKSKYGKYMHQLDSAQEVASILYEVTSDLVFDDLNVDPDQAGRYENLNGVLVDLDPQHQADCYICSNGKVYLFDEADIKIYENKIKTTYIEAEDYYDVYDGQSAWMVRSRSYARGGYDLMLKAQTSYTHTWFNYYADNDSTATLTKTNTYNDGDQTSYLLSKTNNAYAKYHPLMYSCTYNLYWVTYNDLSSQYYTIPAVDGVTQRALFLGDTIDIDDTNRNLPFAQEQKLTISFPGYPELRYNSGQINNNFSDYACFASSVAAGDASEHQIVRYRLIDTNNTKTSATYHYFLLDQIYTGKPDAFGDQTNLICPTYGQATFMVSATVRNTDKNAGMVFLDYIKLVPQVDVND